MTKLLTHLRESTASLWRKLISAICDLILTQLVAMGERRKRNQQLHFYTQISVRYSRLVQRPHHCCYHVSLPFQQPEIDPVAPPSGGRLTGRRVHGQTPWAQAWALVPWCLFHRGKCNSVLLPRTYLPWETLPVPNAPDNTAPEITFDE